MIQLTEAAAGALNSALSATAVPMAGLRLMARSAGCTGFQYEMALGKRPIRKMFTARAWA